ncbi:MAG TPA: hypothetical protein VKI18_16930 [Albitalea sp.]|nr:hypothetical protein [Albitalea sp.]
MRAPLSLPMQQRRHVLAAGLLSVLCGHARAGAAPFVLGTDHPETSFGGRWIRRIYVEAFRRLDIPLRFADYPTQRLSVVLERGDIDGEAQRAERTCGCSTGAACWCARTR